MSWLPTVGVYTHLQLTMKTSTHFTARGILVKNKNPSALLLFYGLKIHVPLAIFQKFFRTSTKIFVSCVMFVEIVGNVNPSLDFDCSQALTNENFNTF